MRPASFLCLLVLLTCGGRSGAGMPAGEGEAEAEGEPREGEAEAEAEGEPGCPTPRVFCDEPAPVCPKGTHPAVDLECLGGNCGGRCYTGDCAPCEDDCESNADCVLVGRHGCDACPDIGGCADAVPTNVVTADACFFTPPYHAYSAPQECPTTCIGDPLCPRCWHCGPDAARCEGGLCVPAWTGCEPDCVCD